MKKVIICVLSVSLLVIASTTAFAGRHHNQGNTHCQNYVNCVNGVCQNENCTYPNCTPKYDGTGNNHGRGMHRNSNCIYQ